MIDTLPAAPTTVGVKFADGVRLLGLLSVPVGAVGWGTSSLATLGIPTLVLWLPKLLKLRPALDASFGLALLVAAWSIILNLYSRWTNWDLAVHATLNGLIAAVGVIALARVGALPRELNRDYTRAMLAVITTMLGVTCGVVWEFAEWAANEFLGQSLFVSYTDTLGDIAVGGLGALVSGFALRGGGRNRAPKSTNHDGLA